MSEGPTPNRQFSTYAEFEAAVIELILRLEQQPDWKLTSLLKEARVDASALVGRPLSGLDLSECDLSMMADRGLDLRGAFFGSQLPPTGSWLSFDDLCGLYRSRWKQADRRASAVVQGFICGNIALVISGEAPAPKPISLNFSELLRPINEEFYWNSVADAASSDPSSKSIFSKFLAAKDDSELLQIVELASGDLLAVFDRGRLAKLSMPLGKAFKALPNLRLGDERGTSLSVGPHTFSLGPPVTVTKALVRPAHTEQDQVPTSDEILYQTSDGVVNEIWLASIDDPTSSVRLMSSTKRLVLAGWDPPHAYWSEDGVIFRCDETGEIVAYDQPDWPYFDHVEVAGELAILSSGHNTGIAVGPKLSIERARLMFAGPGGAKKIGYLAVGQLVSLYDIQGEEDLSLSMYTVDGELVARAPLPFAEARLLDVRVSPDGQFIDVTDVGEAIARYDLRLNYVAGAVVQEQILLTQTGFTTKDDLLLYQDKKIRRMPLPGV